MPEEIKNKSTLTDKISLFIASIAIAISWITYLQTEKLDNTSSKQFKNTNILRNKLTSDLNKIHNDVLKENTKNLVTIQSQNNLLVESIKNLKDRQNELILAHNDLTKNNNKLVQNYTNVYQEIEKIKKETSESQRLINFISVTSNAMRCDVEDSSNIISYSATELFNTLERKDSKVLLLDFLSNLASTNNSRCDKNITIKLKGLDLNGLNLFGININNLYCENCKAFSTNYHYSSYQNKCKKPKRSYITKLEGRNTIGYECGWKYIPYATVDYLDLRKQ